MHEWEGKVSGEVYHMMLGVCSTRKKAAQPSCPDPNILPTLLRNPQRQLQLQVNKKQSIAENR